MNEKIQVLMQLMSTMDDAVKKLEEAYNSREISKFEKLKKEILFLQEKIDEVK